MYVVECIVTLCVDTDSYASAREIALDALSTIPDQAVYAEEPWSDILCGSHSG